MTEVMLLFNCELLKFKDNHFPSSLILEMVFVVQPWETFCFFWVLGDISVLIEETAYWILLTLDESFNLQSQCF